MVRVSFDSRRPPCRAAPLYLEGNLVPLASCCLSVPSKVITPTVAPRCFRVVLIREFQRLKTGDSPLDHVMCKPRWRI